MKIQLVSCAHVNALQYYDVLITIDGKEFSLLPVLYSSIDYSWYVKLPDRPLFVTTLYSDLMQYLSTFVRELFNM